jgi:glucosamine--fructose-6-phosphate aminotransferase (isomerizing)
LLGPGSTRDAAALVATADAVEAWLASDDLARVDAAAHRFARESSAVIVGAGYGVPIASELALKMKEASYLHAEGFPAGEFRHGSSAILDRSHALVGIVDDASRAIVQRPLLEAGNAGALRYTIGADIEGIERLGPIVAEPFNTLAWLVVGQTFALLAGRARGVDSDTPRGLTKYVR